jgi:YesN/AraC family two-component response regulator
MLRVVLIDDEVSTLRLLPRVIDWAGLGMEICGTARDGEEGLTLLSRCAPDIVLLDIKMPRMDGLAFAAAARQAKSEAKIILLSAYADFELARTAIPLRISDYLLKPLDEAKLREVLTRVTREIESERRIGGESGGATNPAGGTAPPTVDYARFEKGLARLASQAEPDELREIVAAMLGEVFAENANPEAVLPVVFDLQGQLRAILIQTYGYRTAQAVVGSGVEKLRGCTDPRQFTRLVVEEIGRIAADLRAALASDPGHAAVRRAEEYVRAHYARHQLSLLEVARHVGVSKNYFSQLFHDVVGVRFWDYLTRVRIDAAKSLLCTTTLSNHEISERIGYESEYHFNRKFKELVGVSPRRYQNRSELSAAP